VGYDSDKADDAVWFFENRLTHTKGKYARKSFKLAPWQDQIIRELFGTVKQDGFRQYSTAYVEIPKKNGKSELAAGIALYCLLMDNEEGAEVYSAAATREQAAIVFRVAAQMVRNNSRLSEECRIIDSTKTILVRDDPNCFYKAISADAGTQDGINPSCVVFDELHRQKNRDLWDVLQFGGDTRTQPLLFAITTAGVYGESPICEEQHDYADRILRGVHYNQTFYPVIYRLDEKDDWTFEGEPATETREATGWYKANPALGDFLPIDRVKTAFEKALEMPTEQASFRRLRLNQWSQQETRWIDLKQWDQGGELFNPNDLLGKPCYGGLDLSTTGDITAFVLLFLVDDELFVLPTFWLPEHQLHERSIRDRVSYDVWAKQGLIRLTPGNAIDYSFIRKAINDQADLYEIKEIGHDPWNATQVTLELASDGFKMVSVKQTFTGLTAPSKEFERLIAARKLRHNGNPVLRWMADCVSISQDASGNIKPTKPDRVRSSKRIDGIVAIVNALARLTSTQTFQSVYKTRGIRTL
jgi:phage terminase large subunit-like protein